MKITDILAALAGLLCFFAGVSVRALGAPGDVDLSFNAGTGYINGAVHAAARQPDGKLVSGGEFTMVKDLVRYKIARLLPNGHGDPSFDVDPNSGITFVHSLALQSDGKVVVGHDTGVAGLNADGSLDSSFHNHFLGRVSSILLQPDGTMFISGLLQSSPTDGSPAIVARLHADGSVDPSFSPERLGPNHPGPVTGYRMSRQPDGSMLCAGDYYLPAAFEPENQGMGIIQGLYRLNSDASVDAAFNPGGGFPLSVDSFVLQPDGGVLISHGFEPIKGVMRPFLARLYSTAPPPPLPFAAWAAGFGLSGASGTPGADPDKDGLPNGVEYILDGSPNVPGTSGRPTASVSGGNMLFTFSRDDESETPGATLTVESGTNLVAWPEVFNIGPDTTASSTGVSIAENEAAPDTITVAIPQRTATRMFARLKVTITP